MYCDEMVVVSAAAAKKSSKPITSFREPLAASTFLPTAGSCARLVTIGCTVARGLTSGSSSSMLLGIASSIRKVTR